MTRLDTTVKSENVTNVRTDYPHDPKAVVYLDFRSAHSSRVHPKPTPLESTCIHSPVLQANATLSDAIDPVELPLI